MRRGFTLIEVLVASLLLGILISMLSTLFSQSSIAWSAGTAMVVDLDSSRREIARYQVDADVTLDSKGTVVQSVFSGMKGTDLNSRAAKASSASKVKGIFNSLCGNPDNFFITKQFSCFYKCHIALPYMNTIRINFLCKLDIIIY